MTGLPRGWREIAIDELADEVTGSIAPNPAELYELYSVPSYANGRPEHISGQEIGSSKRPVRPDDVLLCRINPRINRVWYVGATGSHPQLASTEFIPLRLPAGNSVTARYLMWYLRSPKFREWIKLNTEGATGSHTRAKTPAIMRQKIPLAPRGEQERIVTAIEEAITMLDGGEAALESARLSLGRLWRNCVRMAVAGRLAPAHNSPWPERRLGDIAEVGSGATPSRSNPAYWDGGAIPWVTTTLINAGRITRTVEYITDRAVRETSVKLWPPGTILVAMYGEGRTRGRCAELAIHATCNQACAAIRLRPPYSYLGPLLRLYFDATYARNRLLGIGGVQPNLSLGLVKSIVVPTPSPEDAGAAVAVFRQWADAMDAVTATVDSMQTRCEGLRSAILSWAFSGRLVSQDVSEEPVTVLLSRMSRARAGLMRAVPDHVEQPASHPIARKVTA